MNSENGDEYLPTTFQKVKQQPGWENMSDEMAENMSRRNT